MCGRADGLTIQALKTSSHTPMTITQIHPIFLVAAAAFIGAAGFLIHGAGYMLPGVGGAAKSMLG